MPKLEALVEAILKDVVKVQTIRRGRYAIEISGRGVTERGSVRHAAQVKDEWEEILGGLVTKTAVACAALVEKEPNGTSAAVRILESVASALQATKITDEDIHGHQITSANGD